MKKTMESGAQQSDNKILSNYICSLRAVQFLVTIVIIFFKRWRMVLQSFHDVAASSVPRILILDFLQCPQVSQSFMLEF